MTEKYQEDRKRILKTLNKVVEKGNGYFLKTPLMTVIIEKKVDIKTQNLTVCLIKYQSDCQILNNPLICH